MSKSKSRPVSASLPDHPTNKNRKIDGTLKTGHTMPHDPHKRHRELMSMKAMLSEKLHDKWPKIVDVFIKKSLEGSVKHCEMLCKILGLVTHQITLDATDNREEAVLAIRRFFGDRKALTEEEKQIVEGSIVEGSIVEGSIVEGTLFDGKSESSQPTNPPQ